MQLKRPLFVPGRRIEQTGKLSELPFFTRRPASATTGSALPGVAAPRRPLLSRLAENAGALFSVTLSLVLVVALIALVFAFIRELRQDRVLVEAFVAPKDLVEQGYTSTVIAEKMLDEIRAINSQSGSLRARRALESGDAVPDIQIAHGGLSMKAIVRYARRLLDLPDATIGGEIVRRGAALRMNTAIDQQIDKFVQDNGREPTDDELDKIRAWTLSTVRGTVQADILKEDQGQNTCIFSTEFSLGMSVATEKPGSQSSW